MKSLSFLLAILLISTIALSIPESAQAQDHVFPTDPWHKRHDGAVYEKLLPEGVLIFENSFYVKETTNIYFQIEPSEQNILFDRWRTWRTRLIIQNDTWDFTDLGKFGDGDTKFSEPSPDYILYPGYDYTLQVKVYPKLSDIEINEVYEIAVKMVIDLPGPYNPSQRISHYVQFSESGSDEPEPFPHHIVISVLSIILIVAIIIYFIERRKEKKDEEED